MVLLGGVLGPVDPPCCEPPDPGNFGGAVVCGGVSGLDGVPLGGVGLFGPADDGGGRVGEERVVSLLRLSVPPFIETIGLRGGAQLARIDEVPAPGPAGDVSPPPAMALPARRARPALPDDGELAPAAAGGWVGVAKGNGTEANTEFEAAIPLGTAKAVVAATVGVGAEVALLGAAVGSVRARSMVEVSPPRKLVGDRPAGPRRLPGGTRSSRVSSRGPARRRASRQADEERFARWERRRSQERTRLIASMDEDSEEGIRANGAKTTEKEDGFAPGGGAAQAPKVSCCRRRPGAVKYQGMGLG
jgi:hypothetical protein